MSFVFFIREIQGKSGRMAFKGPKAKGSASEEVGTFEDPHLFCKIMRKKLKNMLFGSLGRSVMGGSIFKERGGKRLPSIQRTPGGL